MKLEKPVAVLFDWDLTLADSFFALADAFNYALTKNGAQARTNEQVEAATAFSLKENLIMVFGKEGWEKAKNDFNTHYLEIVGQKVKLMDGAAGLLDKLKEKFNCPFGVVSNKTIDLLQEEINALGLGDIMDVVIGSEMASANKPSPAPVLMAIEKLGLSAGKHIWYVGDTISDARAGMGAGCTTIIIAKPDEAIALEKPEVYVGSIADLRKNVLGI